MTSLWFDEPDKDPTPAPFDPWKKREDKLKEDLRQQKLDHLSSTSNNPLSRKNSKSGNYQIPCLCLSLGSYLNILPYLKTMP